LPTFFKSRIWIDFSSLEAVNENWEKLVRALYGKPAYQKPKLGKPPAYITVDSAAPSNPAGGKFSTFKQALLQNAKGLNIYRREFLSACVGYADTLRIREKPGATSFGAKILEDSGNLKNIRNQLIDWVLLESDVATTNDFRDSLLELLEELLELKSRPPELSAWNDAWFDAHSVFVYETFLYIIAALLKNRSHDVLCEIFTSHYLRPQTERYNEHKFQNFGGFYGHSEILEPVLAPEGKKLFSPAAELIKRQADREDIPFSAVMEAELLVLLMALVTPGVRWYPQTLFYSSRSEFPFFIRATQHKHFLNLAAITGITSADALREAVKVGQERLEVSRWHNFSMGPYSFWDNMNMEMLDSLK
jgi:hypothetical protein